MKGGALIGGGGGGPFQGHPPTENTISALLRHSQRVLISHFMKSKCYSFS